MEKRRENKEENSRGEEEERDNVGGKRRTRIGKNIGETRRGGEGIRKEEEGRGRKGKQ